MEENKIYASVIIPTYNRRKSLEECLDSLSKQTYPFDKFEVVVVNDGSKDDTESFLKEYQKTSPFQLNFVTQKNGGISSARNTGIKNSRGEVVCFTDDDCLADKNWLKNLMVEYKDESIGCVGGDIISHNPTTLSEKYSDERGLVSQHFLQCGPVVTANTSYRKKLVVAAGGFDEYTPPFEDGELGIRVKLNGCDFVYKKEAVVLHKHRAGFRSLLRQQYKYGRAYQKLHKKYLRNFTPDYTLFATPIKIAFQIVFYPVTVIKSFSVKDKKYFLARPFLDVSVRSIVVAGMLAEMFFGKPYPGKPYTEQVPFLPEKTLGSLIKKLKKR